MNREQLNYTLTQLDKREKALKSQLEKIEQERDTLKRVRDEMVKQLQALLGPAAKPPGT